MEGSTVSAGQALSAAFATLSGIMGDFALALEVRKPIPRDKLRSWVARLRKAADILEALL